jgi:hypothetical protein
MRTWQGFSAVDFTSPTDWQTERQRVERNVSTLRQNCLESCRKREQRKLRQKKKVYGNVLEQKKLKMGRSAEEIMNKL